MTSARPATTIFLLLYGDYSDMHKAALQGLLHTDLSIAEVRIWCNAVCRDTFRLLTQLPNLGWQFYVNSENRPKYKLMRDIFNDAQRPITTPWITWLDDDTPLNNRDWVTHTAAYLNQHSDIDFCGRETSGRYYKGGYELVTSSPWYTGAPFGEGISKHVYGWYWWIRTSVMRALDWPDPRLSHNGGDWLLSEALRQQNYKQVNYHYGIGNPTALPRRGLSEVSLGRQDKRKTSKSDGRKASMIGNLDYYRKSLSGAGRSYDNFDNTTITFALPEVEAVGQAREIEQKKAEIIASLKKNETQMPPSQPMRRAAPASQPAQARREELRQRTLQTRALARIVKKAAAAAAPVKMAKREPKSIKRILQDRRRRQSGR